jgi:hypothetical protein
LVDIYFEKCGWLNICTIVFFILNIIYFFVGLRISYKNYKNKKNKSFYPEDPKVEIPSEKNLSK